MTVDGRGDGRGDGRRAGYQALLEAIRAVPVADAIDGNGEHVEAYRRKLHRHDLRSIATRAARGAGQGGLDAGRT